MTSFCALLSGITVTQVSGSDRHFTVNVVGLDPSKQYSIETVPNISPVRTSGSGTSITPGLNTYSFTKSAKDTATTIKLNIKLVSSGATLSSYTLVWSQFKGFSTSTLTSVRRGSLDNQMVADLANMFTGSSTTFRISNVANETVRVNGSGTPETLIASINTPSQTQTPDTVNPTLTFNTTIATQTIPKGATYLLMGSTTLNGTPSSYILAEPFVFTSVFTYDQVAFFDKLFANTFAGGTVIIDGGSVV